MYLITLLLLFGADAASPIWHNTDLEIYNVLNPAHTAVSQTGKVFVLDQRECRVTIYDKQGEAVKSFGKKGEGPGEMKFPNQLFVTKDHLYIQDLFGNNMMQFDLDGNFVKQAKTPNQTSGIHRVPNGWIYATWRYFGENKDPGAVYWTDDTFTEKVLIADMRPKGFTPNKDGGNIMIDMNKAMPMNPALDRPHMVANEDGSKLFFFAPGPRMKVSVIDAAAKKIVDTFETDWRPVAFNKDWGEKQIKAANKPREGGQGFQIKFKGDFPDNFPIVRAAKYADGKLFVQRWRANPDVPSDFEAVDLKGKVVDANPPETTQGRVIGEIDGAFLVLTFDEEEEAAGIALVGKADLKAFLKANPLPEQRRGGIFVMGG